VFTVIQAEPVSGVAAGIPTSQAIRAGDFVFLSAQFASDENGQIVSGSIETETRLTFANIQGLLAKAGLALSDIVQVRCYLANVDDIAGFNRVYQQTLSQPYPVRTMLMGCLPCDGRVAVDVVAYAG